MQTRISNLKAGLKTWEHHLERVQELHADFDAEIREIGEEIRAVESVLEEEDEKQSNEQDKTENEGDDDGEESMETREDADGQDKLASGLSSVKGSTLQENLLKFQVGSCCANFLYPDPYLFFPSCLCRPITLVNCLASALLVTPPALIFLERP